MWYHDVTIHGQIEPIITKSPKSQDYQIISWNRCNECYQRLTLECNFFHELVRSMCSVFDDCQNRRMEICLKTLLAEKAQTFLWPEWPQYIYKRPSSIILPVMLQWKSFWDVRSLYFWKPTILKGKGLLVCCMSYLLTSGVSNINQSVEDNTAVTSNSAAFLLSGIKSPK